MIVQNKKENDDIDYDSIRCTSEIDREVAAYRSNRSQDSDGAASVLGLKCGSRWEIVK